MRKYISKSDTETKAIASRIAKESKNRIFALTGELGAGKTVFVQGFAKGLGISEKIISPTFVLIRLYQIPQSPKTLYHIDLYRLDKTEDFHELGLNEILANPNNIVLIEWAEKIKHTLPEDTAIISFKKVNNSIRRITINFL